MVGSKPLRRDAERNRQRILAAANALVAEVGLDITHNDIARAAEVGVGTVYRRFPDRQELIDELFDERVDRIIALVDEARRIEDPWQALCAFVTGNLELQAGDRGLKDLMVGNGRATELAKRAQRRIGPAVRELVKRAHAAGQLRPDVGVEDFPLIQEMVGAVMEAARHIDPDLWRRALALVLDGYRADARQREPLPGATPTPEQIEQVLTHSRPAPRR
ncbi:TetR/AcrR family transcriptional regulator [Kutzneria kofuensis]|uniref:AcrR family transcriptional regulator n=1 Tax=Kutzneria kofuensis TaxID=103725 RepID=A0A7W9NHH5_9PSEU|nr:TetR/AcrR family transcriptional regulator [Kutzneria kofuensis]MBB5892569.1 AcrR family transcriptional regulator [Kutzneria kofuensis]